MALGIYRVSLVLKEWLKTAQDASYFHINRKKTKYFAVCYLLQ